MSDEWVVTMPKLGETVTEGTIGSWRKQVGDTVEFDDPLFEVSTDKVDSEIPSPYDGVMIEILVGEGETAPVGTVLARIGEPGATAAPAPSATPASGGATAPAAASAAPATAGTPAAADRNGRMLSPLVRRLVAESGLDVATITGSGEGGRIRREDVQRAIAAAEGHARQAAPAQPASAVPAAPERELAAGPPPVTEPRIARPAAQLGPRDEAVPLPRIR